MLELFTQVVSVKRIYYYTHLLLQICKFSIFLFYIPLIDTNLLMRITPRQDNAGGKNDTSDMATVAGMIIVDKVEYGIEKYKGNS